MSAHHLLKAIPDGLLQRDPATDVRSQQARANSLVRWCEERGFRPTFDQLDHERARRTTNHERTTA